jgi:hypothetical protein
MDLTKGGDSFDWFIMAMAHARLDDKDEARKWFDRAVVWMDKNKPQDEELRRFRTEAATVLAQPDVMPNGKEAFAHDGRDR